MLKFMGIGLSNFKRYRISSDALETFVVISAFAVIYDTRIGSNCRSIWASECKRQKAWPVNTDTLNSIARGCISK